MLSLSLLIIANYHKGIVRRRESVRILYDLIIYATYKNVDFKLLTLSEHPGSTRLLVGFVLLDP